MNDINFIYYSLKSRFFNSSLSVLLTAFGVAIAILILQFEKHLESRLLNDGKGIDIVVSAKGSPLQIVLSSVYHIDIPTGNIPYSTINTFSSNPLIKKIIPIALGDNWKGLRIVGTTYEYINHYDAKLTYGRLWQDNYEVVIGSSVNLLIDDEFKGSHGLIESVNSHDHGKYKVVGVLEPTNTVLDRLILTSLNSVLSIHGLTEIDNIELKNEHDHHENKNHDEHDHNKINEDSHHDDHDHDEPNHKKIKDDNHDNHHQNHNSDKNKDGLMNNFKKFNDSEITALLITTKTPIANVNLPKEINKNSSLMAANPSIEISRLSSIIIGGSKSLKIFSILIILIAILSVFSGLASNLETRLGDLTILRAIGYSKSRIFKLISMEGIIIVVVGLLIGTLFGYLSFSIILQNVQTLQYSGVNFKFSFDLLKIIIPVFFAGIIAAFLPAYKGSKISIANQLSLNK